MLLYADGGIQWTTGDDSGGFGGLGGTEALAGINVGDGVNYATIPGSLTPSIINIAGTSNVGIPGVWMFKVSEGNCLDLYMYIIYIYVYKYISVLGKQPFTCAPYTYLRRCIVVSFLLIEFVYIYV